MKKIISQNCLVVSNRRLNKAGLYFRLRVSGFAAARRIWPGNFVHVKVTQRLDPYFRRAFSIAGYDPVTGDLDIIYKIVGRGTALLGELHRGDSLDLIGPLGNRFTKPPKSSRAVIVAGGVGLPPLLYFAEQLIATGRDPASILFLYGGRTRDDLIELSRLRKLGVTLTACTDDGSYGFHGLVTVALFASLPEITPNTARVYGCGPEPMLAALQKMALKHNLTGEVSLEAPMPCGVGVCLGCIKPTLADPTRYVRVCYDGPVFSLGEVQI